MPTMDYSLIQRTPNGTGKILVTTPGSPDTGSYVTESDMKNYINQGMVAKTDIAQSLGSQTDKVPSNKCVNDAISALSDAINAIMPIYEPMTMESGFLLDWGGLYKVNGMYMGNIGIYFNTPITAGTTIKIATLRSALFPSNESYPAMNSFATTEYFGAILYNTGTGELLLIPNVSLSEGRICFNMIGKALN